MKVLELLLILIDKLIRSFENKQAQKEQDDLERNPDDWFSEHFDNRVHKDSTNKASETNPKD
jgi:hypothetical protein